MKHTHRHRKPRTQKEKFDLQRKKRLKTIPSICGAIFLLIGAAVVFSLRNELRTLISMRKIGDNGAFTMTYYGDYGFDEFLKVGASNDEEIEEFITGNVLKNLPFKLGDTGSGCTAFTAINDNHEIIYGRNYDSKYAPTMQLYTNPPNGYRSVSTVNLSYAGFSESYLPDSAIYRRFHVLAAPYLPFDGMNEMGVAIALLSVPEAQPPHDDSKLTLNTTTAIRLVLDKAASVDEAVELLKNYNIYFSRRVDCHFFIADKSGKSVIVEYYDNDAKIVETSENYQIASNFIAYNGLNIGEGDTEFERYDAVEKRILENGGKLNEKEAVDLLAEVGVDGKLQWSTVYNLSTGEVKWFVRGDKDNVNEYKLTIK